MGTVLFGVTRGRSQLKSMTQNQMQERLVYLESNRQGPKNRKSFQRKGKLIHQAAGEGSKSAGETEYRNTGEPE